MSTITMQRLLLAAIGSAYQSVINCRMRVTHLLISRIVRSVSSFHKMSSRKTLPFGAWSHGLSPSIVSKGGEYKSFTDLSLASDGTLLVNKVSTSDGQKMLFRRDRYASKLDKVETAGSVKNSVNEYGGRAVFANSADEYAYTANSSIYWARRDEKTQQLTQKDCIFADINIHGDQLFCIVEDCSKKRQAVARFTWTSPNKMQLVAEGAGFYATPRVSPDGSRLLLMEWEEGSMPWDSTTVRLLDFDKNGDIVNNQRLLPKESSSNANYQAFQWLSNDAFYFISDIEDYWKLYRYNISTQTHQLIADSTPRDLGDVQWQIGNDRWYSHNKEFIVYTSGQKLYVKRLDDHCAVDKTRSIGSTQFTHYKDLHITSDNSVFCIAAGPIDTDTLLEVRVGQDESNIRVIDCTLDSSPFASYGFSSDQQELIECPVKEIDGTEINVRAFLYPPINPRCQGPNGQCPPVIVVAHGGPTGASYGTFDIKKLFWRSHGFAVCDVNYRGSTGYGRAFRKALYGSYGDGDVRDICAVASSLVDRNLVDGRAVFIMGSSSSGYTLLRALYQQPSLFAAGVCSYGFANPEMDDTHRFEFEYMYQLVAPVEDRATWAERNLEDKLDQIKTPGKLLTSILDKNSSLAVLLFHGIEDKVVTPAQSKLIYETLHARGVRTELVNYKGEGHGFRIAANIEDVLQRSLKFIDETIGVSPDLETVTDLSTPIEAPSSHI